MGPPKEFTSMMALRALQKRRTGRWMQSGNGPGTASTKTETILVRSLATGQRLARARTTCRLVWEACWTGVIYFQADPAQIRAAICMMSTRAQEAHWT